MTVMRADVKVGQSLRLSGTGDAMIRIIAKSGQLARLEILAAETMAIELPQKETEKALQKLVAEVQTDDQ